MNNIKKLQFHAHIDGMRNKEHQNGKPKITKIQKFLMFNLILKIECACG
jgi:hypothetical protein